MKVRPFKAIRPNADIVDQVTCLPYDVFSEREARDIVEANPKSFLKIVRPETAFPEGTDPSSQEVYERARDFINENIANGVFEADDSDCFYIYREIMNGRDQTGLVACFAVDDYLEGNIKKHEFTRHDKEDDRFRHIDICSANTGLVFLAFREGEAAREVLDHHTTREPLYDYNTSDGVHQIVWRISDPAEVETIRLQTDITGAHLLLQYAKAAEKPARIIPEKRSSIISWQ